MPTLRFAVADADTGSRLDSALASRLEIGTRSLAERLLDDGAVRVDGVRRRKSHRLEPGEVVVVELPEVEAGLASEPVTVGIAFEDEYLVVVDKPPGMTMHPGAGRKSGTLAGQLVALGAVGGDPDRPGIVHRLDRDTSGLLVVARSQAVFDALRETIRERKIERRYLALVKGRARSRAGRIDAPIGRARRDPTKRSLDTEEPRDAVTWFETVETLGERTLLDVTLETGRTHQIRVHLAAIDLPVCGDVAYGARGDLGLERQFLHAHRLRFEHPVTGSTIEVVSPVPDDLAAALARARLDV